MNVVISSIPEQRQINGRAFPLVHAPDRPCALDDLLRWLADRPDALRQELQEHGAVLLRGFPVAGPTDFDAVVRAGQFRGMPYIGGAAPRTDVHEGRVLTTNESPPEAPIPFHHEMSQVPEPPAYVIFYCELPPSEGGETPIVHSGRVYERFRDASPAFADHLEATGARYVRVMPQQDDDSSPIGRSWRATFQTDDPAEAEARMAEMGMEWRWLEGGDLYTVTRPLPAVRTDHRTGQKTFFNSVVAAYTGWVDERNDPTRAVRCGDDSPVDGEALMATARAMQEECVAFRWQRGDVLILDNHLVMHSRRPFSGPRQILASIACA